MNAQAEVPLLDVGLVRTRHRLRLILALIVASLPLGEAVLLCFDAIEDNNRASVLYDVAEAWIPRLPLILLTTAAVVLIGCEAVRLLPTGRAAAKHVPLISMRALRRAGATAFAVTVIGLGPIVGWGGLTGLISAAGGGQVVTVGVDAVPDGSSNAGRGTVYFLDVNGDQVVAEGGGKPHSGQRYGRWPSGATHVWDLGAGSVTLGLALLGGGTLLTFGGFYGLGRGIRLLRRERRAAIGASDHRPPDGGSALTALVVVLAVGAGAGVLAKEVDGYQGTAHVVVGALRPLQPALLVFAGEPNTRTGTVLARHILSDPLRTNDEQASITADVTRFVDATAAQAYAADQTRVAGNSRFDPEQAVTLADGPALVSLTGNSVRTLRVRGSVVVDLTLDGQYVASEDGGASEALRREQLAAPAADAALMNSADHLLSVSIPWWR